MERLLRDVYIPYVTISAEWGTLSGPEGQETRTTFLRKLHSYVAVLTNARDSIEDAVKLTRCSHPGLVSISTPAEILAAAGNSELLEAAEACTLRWCKEIEQILTMSEQMRKESDDAGPHVELEYWKKRMAKFDTLTTSIKNRHCRITINILVAAKSKVVQVILYVQEAINTFQDSLYIDMEKIGCYHHRLH